MKMFMKSIAFSSIYLGFLLFIHPAHAIPIMSFDVSNSTPSIGNAISVDIVVTDVTNLYAFNLDVAYDSTILDVSSVVPGTLLSNVGLTLGDLGLFGFDITTPGEIQDINDSLLGAVSGVTGSGVLASVYFNVISSGISTLSFMNVNMPASTELVDAVGFPIAISEALSATITVTDVPEPNVLLLMGSVLAVIFAYRVHDSANYKSTDSV